jgi:hypothetical protein
MKNSVKHLVIVIQKISKTNLMRHGPNLYRLNRQIAKINTVTNDFARVRCGM